MSRTISNATERGADTNMGVVMPLTTNLMLLSTVPSSGTILPEARGTSTVCTVSFSQVILSQGAVNKVFLGVFLIFLAFFHSKIWAKFYFGTFEPYK